MDLPTRMRGVLLTGHGGFDKLEYRDGLPVPVPRPGEVLIEVAACGMNKTDINTRTGWYSKSISTATGTDIETSDGDSAWGGGFVFPRIQGADPGGVLEKARYLGSEVDGGYAEYVSVPDANAHRVESDFTDVELASFPCSYATAEHMLHRAAMREGQWVLVTGASGGVGGALIQLAKRRLARVVALTSGSKIDAVRTLGADEVLDRDDPKLAEAILDTTGVVDVFTDVIGGDTFAPLLETVRRGGHYATAGAIAGPIVPLDLRTLYLRDLTLHGATVLPPEVFANLVRYIELGEVAPVVSATFPLGRLAEAQAAFMRKQHVGALVIEVR
jgi:NADPH:quinone reductase-like Zn-dependent oxidoreductase